MEQQQEQQVTHMELTTPATAAMESHVVSAAATQVPYPQCMARRADKAQCTRKQAAGQEFCQGHLNKCTYGRIDMPLSAELAAVKVPKTRGRKRKQQIDDRFYDDNYATLWPEVCDGERVLVDRYDNVYSYNIEAPVYMGIKQITGKIDRTSAPRTN